MTAVICALGGVERVEVLEEQRGENVLLLRFRRSRQLCCLELRYETLKQPKFSASCQRDVIIGIGGPAENCSD